METTFIDLLRRRADQHPDRLAFTRWNDDTLAERHLRYGELDTRVRAVAASLQEQGLTGERVMLLMRPGLEYVVAFVGCLYAGAVAVPYYPPSGSGRSADRVAGTSRHAGTLPKLHRIAAKAEIAAAILDTSEAEAPAELFEGVGEGVAVRSLGFGELAQGEAARWRPPNARADALAFLQFTSGSTGHPRGVMVSHGNLIHNSALIRDAFGHTEGTLVGVIWLPPYHDMGLIGGILQPIFCGGRCVLMAPAEFLQRPRRWLEAISRHRGTTSGGPNFAYDLCVRRVTGEQRLGLDLSSWTVAFTGAEPVRAATMQAFANCFGTANFDPRAFLPCYGLAEATLAVTAAPHFGGSQIARIDRAALAQNKAVAAMPDDPTASCVVACGAALGDQRVAIVQPGTTEPLPAGSVGEVWVSGASVAAGYWRDPDATAASFHAYCTDGTGPFLRTGDLGYLDEEGRLYIVGRQRDLIIVRGTNYHPADLEHTIENSHPAIRSGGAAAFSCERDHEEQLAIVAELQPRSGAMRDRYLDDAVFNAIVTAVRAAVLAEHNLEATSMLLVAAGGLSRTTSGKLERYACRERFMAGTFQALYAWRHAAAEPEIQRVRRVPETALERQIAGIWSTVLGVTDVSLDDDFFEAGGHSLLALQLVDAISAVCGVEVPLRALVEHSTLSQLARYAAEATRQAAPMAPLTSGTEQPFDPFPLTAVQEAYLFGRSTAFELGGVATQGVAEFAAGSLDVGRLQDAIDRLIARHEMLRAVIRPDGQQQVLATVPTFPLEYQDFGQSAVPDIADRRAALRERLAATMRPLDQWPLFDIVVCRSGADQWSVFARFELVVADLHSLRLLWRELGLLYENPEAVLPPVTISFRDWVSREESATAAAARERSVEFWRERLPQLPPAPELPYTRSFRSIGAPRFRRRTMRLDSNAWRTIRRRAGVARVTPAGLLLTAFSRVLAVWSRHNRFTLTLTFFNRPEFRDLQNVVGDFTSLLLFPIHQSALTFQESARTIQQDLWETLDHRHADGLGALREVARHQGRTAQAIFPVVFTCAIGDSSAAGGAPWSWLGQMVDSVSSTPQVVLDCQVQEEGDGLLVTWDTVDEVFPPGALDDMFAAYERCLHALNAESAWIDPDLTLVPPHDLARAAGNNDTDGPMTRTTLHGLFLAQVDRQPDRTAVIAADGRVLTYRDVDLRSRALAAWIRAQRRSDDELVGIVMQKGWPQVVAALAILRAGAAYLPVDPALPDERRRSLLERGGARLALTDRATDETIGWPEATVRAIVDDWTASPSSGAEEDADDWEGLAYVIFTSGSTGQPKGVALDHRGPVNTILDLNERFRVGSEDRVLGISALGFDLSVYDIFGTLAAGGALVLPAPGSERNPEHWLELMIRHRVTIWNSVPALFEMLCEYARGQRLMLPESLRLAWLSGDWIPVGLPRSARALRPELEIVSMGGATEGSIWSILYSIGDVDPAWRSIPYGRPLRNQRMHVFDDRLRVRPAWVAGDLYIAGIGVARGYWRDPERTAQSFLNHPNSGERLYRTGDVARWLPDGNMEFLGREDGQVKVGGVRIELGEIEAALAAHPAVGRCALVARHLDGRHAADASAASTRQLVAFVVPADGSVPAASDLQEWLGRKLPSAMIPRRFVVIDAFPLTDNGKVDTARLHVPPSAAPTGRTLSAEESVVRASWALALEVAEGSLNPEDNFFDVGGSSVTLVRVAADLSAHAGRRVPLMSLFEHPTMAGMARLLSDDQSHSAPTADARRRADQRKQQLSSLRRSPQRVDQRGT